jgi:hypothetical protein
MPVLHSTTFIVVNSPFPRHVYWNSNAAYGWTLVRQRTGVSSLQMPTEFRAAEFFLRSSGTLKMPRLVWYTKVKSRTQRSNTKATYRIQDRLRSLPGAKWIRSTPCNIIFQHTPRSPRCHSDIPIEMLYEFLISHMPHVQPTSSSWYDPHPSIIIIIINNNNNNNNKKKNSYTLTATITRQMDNQTLTSNKKTYPVRQKKNYNLKNTTGSPMSL